MHRTTRSHRSFPRDSSFIHEFESTMTTRTRFCSVACTRNVEFNRVSRFRATCYTRDRAFMLIELRERILFSIFGRAGHTSFESIASIQMVRGREERGCSFATIVYTKNVAHERNTFKQKRNTVIRRIIATDRYF